MEGLGFGIPGGCLETLVTNQVNVQGGRACRQRTELVRRPGESTELRNGKMSVWLKCGEQAGEGGRGQVRCGLLGDLEP